MENSCQIRTLKLRQIAEKLGVSEQNIHNTLKIAINKMFLKSLQITQNPRDAFWLLQEILDIKDDPKHLYKLLDKPFKEQLKNFLQRNYIKDL